MQPLFVFCADLHLEDGAWTTRPGIYGDAYYSFRQIVDYCIEHKLPLILGGDVLEKKSNLARPIAQLCAEMDRMARANVPLFYIQGNHEYDRNAPWLSVHTWPKHMHEASFNIGSVKVCGFDWLPRGDIQEAFTRVPQNTDILITHQVWKDLMGNVGRTECELTDVHHVQTVLAGDFHVTKIVESVNAQGKPIRMLSPGSTCMQDMGESPEKFFFVIGRNTTTNAIEFEPVNIKTRALISYRVETQEELDDICAGKLVREITAAAEAAVTNGLPAEIQKPLVRVKFDKHLPDAYLRVVTCVGEQAHLFCEAITEKMQPRSAPSRDAVKNDLLTAVADLAGDGTPAYKLAAALLSAEDPAREIDVLFNKYMNEESDATSETGSSELGPSSPEDV